MYTECDGSECMYVRDIVGGGEHLFFEFDRVFRWVWSYNAEEECDKEVDYEEEYDDFIRH